MGKYSEEFEKLIPTIRELRKKVLALESVLVKVGQEFSDKSEAACAGRTWTECQADPECQRLHTIAASIPRLRNKIEDAWGDYYLLELTLEQLKKFEAVYEAYEGEKQMGKYSEEFEKLIPTIRELRKKVLALESVLVKVGQEFSDKSEAACAGRTWDDYNADPEYQRLSTISWYGSSVANNIEDAWGDYYLLELTLEQLKKFEAVYEAYEGEK